MTLSDKKGIQTLVQCLAELGLKEVVVTPGSRNAPFVISFNRHPAFHLTSIRDERSAGFFALGRAMETNRPVALVCTSGSAPLNYAPAIVEAYYQRIPLLILTADRPKEWTDQGNGQTINQTEVYKNYIRKSYECRGDAREDLELWAVRRKVSEGYHIAAYSDRGPVHFNVPLQEPLYNTVEVEENKPLVFKEEMLERKINSGRLIELQQVFKSSKKVLVLVGQHPKEEELETCLGELSEAENVVVLTESTSNMHHPHFVENIDRCITNMNEAEAEDLSPDILITLGGAVVSKRIKKFLRVYPPQRHWNIHPFDATMDTYQHLTLAIPMRPKDFFQQFLDNLPSVKSDYKNKWIRLKNKKKDLHEQFLNTCAYSDFKVFQKIYEHLPSHLNLHLSNSSVVRYAQLFDNSKIETTFSNRGTSGIDGSTSTAMGTASASPEKRFLLITGDVAFHYDINALWNETDVQNLNIIVINNGGGGIFRIIEGPNSVEERAEFLETEMNQNVEKIAAHYRWNYLSAKNEKELELSLKEVFEKERGRTILEIFTDPATNPKVLRDYWKALKG